MRAYTPATHPEDQRALESAVERALTRAAEHLATAPRFSPRPQNLAGTNIGFRGPEVLGEDDGVMVVVRSLVEEGVPWEWLHLKLVANTWMFRPPHPAAPVDRKGGWNCDLAIVPPERLLTATLPAASAHEFHFCALMEFKLQDDYWRAGGGNRPPTASFQRAIQRDCDKLVRLLKAGVAPTAWACAFAYADPLLPPEYIVQQQQRHEGLRVRLLRAW